MHGQPHIKLYTVSELVIVFAVRRKVHMDLTLQPKSKFYVLFGLGIKSHLRLSRFDLIINTVKVKQSRYRPGFAQRVPGM